MQPGWDFAILTVETLSSEEQFVAAHFVFLRRPFVLCASVVGMRYE